MQFDLVWCFSVLLQCLFFFPALEFVLGSVGFAEILVRNKWTNHVVLLLWWQILPSGLAALCELMRMLCTATLIVWMSPLFGLPLYLVDVIVESTPCFQIVGMPFQAACRCQPLEVPVWPFELIFCILIRTRLVHSYYCRATVVWSSFLFFPRWPEFLRVVPTLSLLSLLCRLQ